VWNEGELFHPGRRSAGPGMTSSVHDGEDDDLGDLPEGLLPEGVLDDAADDDVPLRAKPLPAPRKPPPGSPPRMTTTREEDDETAPGAARGKANTWTSAPPGPAKSPGATSARIPAPRDTVRPRRSPPHPPAKVFPNLLRRGKFHAIARGRDARWGRRGAGVSHDDPPDLGPSPPVPFETRVGYISTRAARPCAPRHRAGVPRTVPWVPCRPQARPKNFSPPVDIRSHSCR